MNEQLISLIQMNNIDKELLSDAVHEDILECIRYRKYVI